MDSGSIFTILVLAVLILMSAYFSASETAFSSLNRIRLKNLADCGNKRAQLAFNLSENYDRLLSAILIGNNIVNIASTSLATVIFVKYYGDAGVVISTVVMTILVLIFGEISPKSLAKQAPESFAMFSAPILKVFIYIFSPLNFFLMTWKKLLTKIFKISNDRNITEAELISIVEEAEHEGGIDAQESELIRCAIAFNDLDVSDVFTPRMDVIAISDKEDKGELREIFLKTGYSRLPVFNETIDNIIGVINQKDFHNHIAQSDNTIESIVKPAVFVTPNIKLSKLLKHLQQTKCHIAVIIDEFGGTKGIVTLEDIIEELVGEIWDEHDEIIDQFKKIADNEYKISCSANLDKMFDLFDIDKEFDITTVNGWVIHELGKIPKVGDSFTFENLHITVSKTDYRRVLEISIIVNDKLRIENLHE